MKVAEAIGAQLFNANGWANVTFIQCHPLVRFDLVHRMGLRVQGMSLNWCSVSTSTTLVVKQGVLVKEPNSKKCVIIKEDNLCVMGPYETMSRFHH